MGQFVVYLEEDNPNDERFEVTISLPPKLEDYLATKQAKRVGVDERRFIPEEGKD
ncbi:hypothetical protein IIA79_04840 [bacterium]|nr:hypothetical protein [bacterium]